MLGGIWGCILSELKEYTPRPPKKNSGRDFDFPPRPSLKRPKEGPAGPSFGNHPGVGRGCGFWDIFGRTVGGGLCPAPGGGSAWGWLPCGCFAAHGMGLERTSNGNPINHRSEICYGLCFSFHATRFAGAGRVSAGGWCFCRFNLCHCEERSDAAIRSFGWRFGFGEPVRAAT